MKYPFMYQVMDSLEEQTLYFNVVIAQADYEYCRSQAPGRTTLKPGIDLYEESHIFDSEKEALQFIKDWWSKEEVK